MRAGPSVRWLVCGVTQGRVQARHPVSYSSDSGGLIKPESPLSAWGGTSCFNFPRCSRIRICTSSRLESHNGKEKIAEVEEHVVVFGEKQEKCGTQPSQVSIITNKMAPSPSLYVDYIVSPSLAVYVSRNVRVVVPDSPSRSAFCMQSPSHLSRSSLFFFFENYRETTRTAVARREARATFDHSPNTGMAVAAAGHGRRSVFSFSASLFSRSPSPVNVKKKAPKCVDSLLDYIFFDM